MQEIISYGYVLEYARKYDNEWRKMLQNLIKAIIMHDPNIFCKNFGCKLIEEDLSHPGKKCLKSFISRHIPNECIFQSMQFMSCKDLVESFNLSNKIKNGSTVQKRKKISPAKLAYRMMYQSLHNIVSENYGSSLRQVPSVPSSFLYF